MTQRVRDFFFVLPTEEYALVKECLPRHSIGYDALDLAIPVGEGKRAFTSGTPSASARPEVNNG